MLVNTISVLKDYLKNEGYSLDLTGFDFSEAEKLMDEFKEEVESDEMEEETVPPPPDDPITKRGDIWLLGKHRLMCGDSTVKADVEKLMNNMVHGDVPFRTIMVGIHSFTKILISKIL